MGLVAKWSRRDTCVSQSRDSEFESHGPWYEDFDHIPSMLVSNYCSFEDDISPRNEKECVVTVRKEEMIARPHRLSVLDPNDDSTSESVGFSKNYAQYQFLKF